MRVGCTILQHAEAGKRAAWEFVQQLAWGFFGLLSDTIMELNIPVLKLSLLIWDNR